jgi:hypothetical protein
MRAGKIQMTHKGDAVDDPKSVAGKDGLGNNNHFKAASFQPKKGIDFEALISANQHFKATFGSEIKELSESAVSAAIRSAVDGCRDDVQVARDLLAANGSPASRYSTTPSPRPRRSCGAPKDDAILTFNSSHEKLKEGIKRANELETAPQPRCADTHRGRAARSHDPVAVPRRGG